MAGHLKKSNMLPHNLGLLETSLDASGNMTNTTSTTPGAEVTTTNHPNTTFVPVQSIPACDWIIYEEIGGSRVRVWDLVILIPNAFFLIFLLLRLKTAVVKLQRTNSPIFFAFYGLVFVVAVISVLRCVVSMTVNAAVPAGDITDKVLWLILRFFLLATELSVVIFGVAFGHLDSKTSIQRVLIITTFIALGYSITQGVLEFSYPDSRFHIKHEDREYDIFGHGGMLFWFASSVFFFVVYIVICFLPFTPLRNRFALPSKKSFYLYCGLLAFLNLLQAIGSGLLYYNVEAGLCIVDLTTYLYFTGFAPLVYGTFLRYFFATSQPPNILFSYKAQVDDGADEDSVSLPHQIYTPYGRPEHQGEHPQGASVDSTHFDERSPNPLYSDDLHFPVNAELKMSFESDYFGQTPEGASVCYMPPVARGSSINS